MKKILLLLIIVCVVIKTNAQQNRIVILDSGTKTSLRGLSVVSDNIIWASGSSGKVARSTDGGKHFEWITVPGYEKSDFRDIEAFDANTAIIMGITQPAVILKTTDGGRNWKKVYEDKDTLAFFDAMDFADDKNGVVIGDPLNDNCIYRVYTTDKGETWSRPLDDCKYLPAVQKGEAMFASSGSNVKFIKAGNTFTKNDMLVVTGGTASDFLSQKGYTSIKLPLLQGQESTGANSIACLGNNICVVGGDFMHDKDTTNNCTFSADLGKTWQHCLVPPHGYRSCVKYIDKDKLLTCGTSGVDVSADGGKNWEQISTQSFHVCGKAKQGTMVLLAGSNGKIAVYQP